MAIQFKLVKKPKKEFAKKIMDRVTFFCVLITFYTMAFCWKTGDSTPLVYLIPAWFLEFGTATAYYYNKAKAENVIKISNNKEVEEDGI